VTRPIHVGVPFDRPLHQAVAPGSDRWFIGLEQAKVVTIPLDESSSPQHPHIFADLRLHDPSDPKAAERRRLWSLAFHPGYQRNGQVYLCYIEHGDKGNVNRIVRMTVPAELRRPGTVPTADPATLQTVIEWPCGEDHFGGCLAFGADGMLYFSAGDGHGYADGNQTGQDISDLNASILRIDVDRPTPGAQYSVPADNPFVGKHGARPEVWAYGLRNVWKFSFDRRSGELWAADVGQDLWEPVVRVERGGNYGWSVTEGTHDFRPERRRGPTPILPPVYQHEHSEARSITGGFVYRGRAFPDLIGRYIYGDYETGKVWALQYIAGKPPVVTELVDTPLKLVAFGERPDGELVLLDYQGTLHRLERNPAAGDTAGAGKFPRRLSQTGLFADTARHVVAPGVVPYEVNSPLWSDGAIKHRYLAVPPGAKIGYRPRDAWSFPDGSVLVKTFELELHPGHPASRRRLETRLMHLEEGHWRGYTYIWNADQTDAELLDDPRGKDQAFDIADASVPGGVRKQIWHYPGRAECTLCHTMPAGFVLGLSTLQMNRAVDHGGRTENQIAALETAGYFNKAVLAAHDLPPDDESAYAKLPRMPSPADTSAPLGDRARAYLDANCSHCHRKWGGGNALFELTYGKSLDETRTVLVAPQHGSHGLENPKLIVPGSPERSLLAHRMKILGPSRMPRIASSVLDPLGVQVITDWIRQMPPVTAQSP
jgi:uncharacterized repeat protein (TIGR03806 family)